MVLLGGFTALFLLFLSIQDLQTSPDDLAIVHPASKGMMTRCLVPLLSENDLGNSLDEGWGKKPVKTKDQRTSKRDTMILAFGAVLFLVGAATFAVFLLPAIAMIVGGAFILILGFCYKYFGE